jgi:hypothetical protein
LAKKDKKDKKKHRDAPVELAAELVPVAPGDAGARLCYGEPVRESGRTVIPVARADGRPLGYIEIDADGSRYVALADPLRDRALTGVVGLLAALLGALAGVAFGRRHGR